MSVDGSKELISAGAEVAGAAVGGALGFLLGGPGGAVGGGVAGVAVTRVTKAVLTDMANRRLSRREQVRIGATASYALEAIQARLSAGEALRSDGFFDNKADQRPAAEEILEGVLIKAKNEHQEKKLPLLGRFIANLAFSGEVGIGEANHLLRVAEVMTYRQMVVLGLLLLKGEIDSIPLREEDYSDPNDEFPSELVSLLQEIYDLADLGIVWRLSDESRVGTGVMSWRFITPRHMSLAPLGLHLAALIGTDSIDTEDIEDVANLLRV
jgi:hypothetical protein